MNEIKVKVDFEKGTIEKQGITLVSGDYKSTKIVFDFCDAVGTKIFEMNDTEGNLLFSQTIVNNEVILVGEDDEGNDATLFEVEGRYPFEVSLYNNGGKITSANDCLNVTASLVEIGDTIVTPYLPVFDALMTQIDNINITSAAVQDGHTITITNKSGTSTTFTVYDGAYCVSITKTGETATGSFIYTMTFSDGRTFDFTSPKGQAGSDGEDGEDGRGIVSITKTSTVGLVDTYTISYTDSTTSSFTVTNGRDGQGGATTWDSITGKPTAFNPDINGLTSDTSLANGDKFPFYNGTTNKKISFDSLLTIINNALLINDKQDKNDNTLTTTSKQIVGAINELDSEMNNKVDKVDGKGLSTNDYTDAEKQKVANAITEHQSLAAYRTSASQDIIDAAQNNDIANKQATLVSGTNIKTINNQSLLGSGNITVGGGDVWTQVADVTLEEAQSEFSLYLGNSYRDIIISYLCPKSLESGSNYGLWGYFGTYNQGTGTVTSKFSINGLGAFVKTNMMSRGYVKLQHIDNKTVEIEIADYGNTNTLWENFCPFNSTFRKNNVYDDRYNVDFDGIVIKNYGAIAIPSGSRFIIYAK